MGLSSPKPKLLATSLSILEFLQVNSAFNLI